ncbi:MAG: type II toxin-antitoxin system VapC family toxin [Deltaproteobacteria bacterium]|nr:type II toxin-antitoxin system VapC family toxin [Deltaproteobacteria bacterium]
MDAMIDRGPYFLDTNIVMYAVGKDHPHKEPCRAVLEQVERDEIDVVTSVEVLQEVLHRYYSLNRPDLAELAYRSLEKSCEQILSVTKADLDRAFHLLKIHLDIRSRDAIHAAVMLNNGLTHILSTDTHFDRIAGITPVEPRAFQP